ncbi:MAG: hypothetical protein AAFS12_00470 [Cyanobacteria bacterium J06632_19]
MGRKYIIFRADIREEQGAENRLLAHTKAATDILAEYFDSSSNPSPEVGYRVRQFYKIDEFADSQFPEASTHSRIGDWEVIKVEEYTSTTDADFESIVICYCQYSPVEAPLEPLPKMNVPHQLQEVK